MAEISVFKGRFDGQRAVITGGAAGIGLMTATRIVQEGGKVAIWDFNELAIDAACKQIGNAATGIKVDVSDYESVVKAVETTSKKLGSVDILVNSAGITGPNVKTWEYGVGDWCKVVDVNLNGIFYCCKAIVPLMISNQYGRIVNIASIAGKEGNPNAPAYSASKAGVIGLTKTLGKELAQLPIIVNCMTPAAVRTTIFDQMSEEHINYMLSKIPMGRFGEIAEVAAMICWLASKECSFTTGGVFDISGGRATY